MTKKQMSKTTSFGWGLLLSFIGGILVFILLYFLYLKKQRVNLAYYVFGFLFTTIVLFVIFGTFLFGILGNLWGGL